MSAILSCCCSGLTTALTCAKVSCTSFDLSSLSECLRTSSIALTECLRTAVSSLSLF